MPRNAVAIIRASVALAVALAVVLAAGCERQPSQGKSPPAGGDLGMRIVTLAPALTQIIVDLGRADLLVGVARNDAAAPPGLPVVGDYTAVDIEKLLSLKPSFVLMQGTKEGVPPRLQELADAGRFQLVVVPSFRSVRDIGAALFDERELVFRATRPGEESLGTLLGLPTRALALKTQMLMRLALISDATAHAPLRRVLMVLHAQDQVQALGPGATHHELLSFIHAANAAAGASVEAPVLDREKIAEAQPDVILLLAPGAPPLQPLDRDPRLAMLRGLDVPAVRDQRIVLIDDPLGQLPSTSLPRVAAAMARAVHPELAPQIDEAMTRDFRTPASAPVEAPAGTTPDARP